MLAVNIRVEAHDRDVFRHADAELVHSLGKSQCHVIVRESNRFRQCVVLGCKAVGETLAARIPEVTVENAVLVNLDSVLRQ